MKRLQILFLLVLAIVTLVLTGCSARTPAAAHQSAPVAVAAAGAGAASAGDQVVH
ncbi:MAG TPA: hypothetical protein VGC21_13020 [Telluria sp.]|jgi:outer membrane biogenesis lipoprotein LolB